MKKNSCQKLPLIVVGSGLLLAAHVQAAVVTKSPNGADLAAGASWGGAAPGSTDTATWISSSLGAGLTLGAATNWGMIDVEGATGAVGITGSGALTLNGVGGAGINLAAGGVDFSIANVMSLGAAQTWTIGSGRVLTIRGNVTNGANLLTFAGAGNANFSGALGNGAGGLTLNGHGTLTNSGASTFSGNTTVNSGRLVLTDAAVSVHSSPTNLISAGAVMEQNITTGMPSTPTDDGYAQVWTGAGVLQKTGSGVLRIGFKGGNMEHRIYLSAGGVLDVQGGDLNIGWISDSLAANHGGLNLASSATLHDSQPGGMKFDWLSGSGKINNAYNSTTPTLTIGTDGAVNNAAYGVSNNTAIYSGAIGYAENYNGVGVATLNIVKTGGGTQILTGTNGWTGSTTISGGALFINSPGSLAATAITVQSGGTLGGNGTLSGPVTLQNGATLAPGTTSAIGALTLDNTLTMNAGCANILRLAKTGGVTTNDAIKGMTGTLAYAGTLIVTNITSDSSLLANGDTFTLFSKASGTYNGSFSTFVLPPLAGGLAWDVSGLSIDGSIQVVATNAVALPTFNPAGGTYSAAQSVTIYSTLGSMIYYTTDGTAPNLSSPSAPSPITGVSVGVNKTIKAYATKAGLNDSAVATANYIMFIAPNLNYSVAPGGSLAIGVPALLAACSGATALQGLGASVNGATINSDANYIYYASGAGTNNPDNFAYTVSNGNGTTATGRIYVSLASPVSYARSGTVSNGAPVLSFAGIPNYTYFVQSTTNLASPDWQTIGMSTADANGLWTFAPAETKAMQFFRAVSAGDLTVGAWIPPGQPEPPAPLAPVLQPLVGGFRMLACAYTNNLLVADRAANWNVSSNGLQGSLQNGAASWSYSTTVSNLPSTNGTAVAMQLTATLLSGQATAAGVAAAFDFGDWSTNNYVLIPSAVYNGNRNRCEFNGYGAAFQSADFYDPGLPQTQSDVPRLSLNPGDESRIEILTGNAATPAMCFFSPSQQRGFILLTDQQTRFGMSGLMIQESPDRGTASFVVSAPGVRKLRPLFAGFTTSADAGATWNPGDSVTLNFQLYSFPCTNIPGLLDMFHTVRKNETGPNRPRCITPMSQLQTMYANLIDGMYAGNGGGRYYPDENASWISFGWVGGLMNTFPMLALGDAAHLARVTNTFNYAIPAAQTASGYTHYLINSDGSFGDCETTPTGAGTELARCQGDLLFWMMKQLMLLKAQGKTGAINPAWEQFAHTMAVAMTNTWNLRHEFGMYLDLNTGDVAIYNSTSGAMIPGGLALASKYFNEPGFMTVAQQAATMYYNRDFVGRGQTAGACGDILENADSETSFGFMTALMTLYEMTGDTNWLAKSRGLADLCSTWTISYDYVFPAGTPCYNLGAHVAGGVWASTQNKHAVCVPCTSSADPLFKLYRAGQGRRYAELVRDIAACANDLTARSDRPTYGGTPGNLMERLQTGDAEGAGAIGELPSGMNGWVVLGAMLQTLELPGIYVRVDTGDYFVFDHVTTTEVSHDDNGVTLSITNPTTLNASVTVFGENAAQAAQPLGYTAFINWPHVTVNAGATVNVLVKPDGSLQIL